jgi:hypothetical protein
LILLAVGGLPEEGHMGDGAALHNRMHTPQLSRRRGEAGRELTGRGA